MKKALLLLSTCAFLCLSGCSLSNGKEVNADYFIEKADSLPKHNYIKAKSVVERKEKDNNSSTSTKLTNYWVYNSNYSWILDPNKVQGVFYYITISDKQISHIAKDYYDSYLNNDYVTVHYYINPLRIKYNSKKTEGNDSSEVMIEYEFDKYGLITKENYKRIISLEKSNGKYKSTETSSVKITYS